MRSFTAHSTAEINLYLQRRIAQKAQQLNFRRLLQRHQVQHARLQRTNTLRCRTLLCHGKNSFLLQLADSG
jgi:hypothetical protein